MEEVNNEEEKEKEKEEPGENIMKSKLLLLQDKNGLTEFDLNGL